MKRIIFGILLVFGSVFATVLAWPEGDVLIKSLVKGNALGYYIYPGEIASVSMLGDGKELEWELVKGEGLRNTPPANKPCEHAYVFRIVHSYEN